MFSVWMVKFCLWVMVMMVVEFMLLDRRIIVFFMGMFLVGCGKVSMLFCVGMN